MVLFNTYGVFFWRFLESRNYKIQIVAHVGRKSAVVLSGVTEASYSHFFIGRVLLYYDYLFAYMFFFQMMSSGGITSLKM